MRTENRIDAEKQKWLVLTVIVIKLVMDGLDGSMLSIALPAISQSLGVTSGAIIWAVSAYSITTSTLVLFFGRLGDIIGKTRFFLIGIVVYSASSLISGMANSLEMLVAARVIQALGTCCTMANSQGIITMVFPEKQRGKAMGIYGGAVSLGLLAGPTLGGLIVAYMNWQFIFLLKVPFAVAAILLAFRYFPRDDAPRKERVDYPGALLYVVAIVPLLYSLQQGYAAGYTSLMILSGFALSVVAFSAFFTLQRKIEMPMLDLGLFKNPLYSVGILTAFILSFSNSCFNIIIPFYMQGVLGVPVGLAGMYMSISPIIVLFVTPVSGFLIDRVGGEKLALLGQILNCAGLLLMMTLSAHSPVMMMVGYICVINFGSSLFMAPNNTLIMSAVPLDKLGIGGSTSMTIRNIGTTAGISFSTAILYGGMSRVLGYHVDGYVQGSGMEDAFVFGMRNTFILSALVCLLGILVSASKMIAGRRGYSSQG